MGNDELKRWYGMITTARRALSVFGLIDTQLAN